MPVGYKDEKVAFNDTSYNGVTINQVYKDGTGILTDGKFGSDDVKQDKGEGWVGWRGRNSVADINFEFSSVRKFKDVTLTMNVDKERAYAVFKKSQIFFASTNESFSNSPFLEYCPKEFSDDDGQYKRIISLPLCENTARFIKLRLYFGGEWLLITEISFNSGISSYLA